MVDSDRDTVISCSIGEPVVGLKVGTPSGLYYDVLHVSPRQQSANNINTESTLVTP